MAGGIRGRSRDAQAGANSTGYASSRLHSAPRPHGARRHQLRRRHRPAALAEREHAAAATPPARPAAGVDRRRPDAVVAAAAARPRQAPTCSARTRCMAAAIATGNDIIILLRDALAHLVERLHHLPVHLRLLDESRVHLRASRMMSPDCTKAWRPPSLVRPLETNLVTFSSAIGGVRDAPASPPHRAPTRRRSRRARVDAPTGHPRHCAQMAPARRRAARHGADGRPSLLRSVGQSVPTICAARWPPSMRWSGCGGRALGTAKQISPPTISATSVVARVAGVRLVSAPNLCARSFCTPALSPQNYSRTIASWIASYGVPIDISDQRGG